MMKKYLLTLCLLKTALVFAQRTGSPTPFASTITRGDLKKHLYIVAGPEFEGRETATEGQRKAASYIENYFRSLGLQPGNRGSFQMPYPVFQDSLENATLQIDNQNFELNTDFAPYTMFNHTATLMGSEVVFAGYGVSDSTRDDYKDLDVRGKIVLILSGPPPSGQPATRRRINPTARQEAAQRNGAAALLIVTNGLPQATAPGHAVRPGLSVDGFKKNILPNTFFVSAKVAASIMGADYASLNKISPVTKTYPANILLGMTRKITQIESSNVLGFLEGSDLKDQIVVLSAHYDHLGKRDSVIWYGADDDGSGTVALLELAEAFTKAKAAGQGPRRSILFLANSGEEKGLWGSHYYSEHPAFPLENTTVDLNIDMIGRIDPNRRHGDSTNYVYVVGDDKLSSDLRPISEAQNRKYTRMELDYKFNDPADPDRIYYRSDHYNFARKGVPIIFYFDGIHHDYHKPTDTPDKINYDLLEKRTRLVFYTAWEMANRPALLKRDIPLP